MKLIDANDLFKRTCNTPLYNNQDEDIFLDLILDSKEIDPIHAAGGAYCKECTHSELLYKEINNFAYLYGYHCQKYHATMPLNGFCSEGRKDKE